MIKIYLFSFMLLIVSCKKNPLILSKNQENNIVTSNYRFNNKFVKDLEVKTFLDSDLQKQSHKALLQSVQFNDADNGCVLVMETNTGKVRAMVNLESINGKVIESKTNYAIQNYIEPGSFVKTLDVMALLEDKKADTSTVYSSNNGKVTFYGKTIQDTHKGSYENLSLGNALVYSSNTIFATAITQAYKNNPNQFVSKFKQYYFGTNLEIPFSNTNKQIIPQANTSNWSAISLPWMAFGHGLTLSPIQVLNYYNTIANGGEAVQPLFLSQIKDKEGRTKKYEKKVLSSQICSKSTIVQIQDLLRNVVVNGNGLSSKTERISISGKTSSIQINYGKPKLKEQYLSGFVGYFPSEKPRYSIIVILSNPKSPKIKYGTDLAGVVVKSIAENTNL